MKRHSSSMNKFPLIEKGKLKPHEEISLNLLGSQRSKSPITHCPSHTGLAGTAGESDLCGRGQAVSIKSMNAPTLWSNNSSSRILSYPYTQICAKWCMYRCALQHCLQQQRWRTKCPSRQSWFSAWQDVHSWRARQLSQWGTGSFTDNEMISKVWSFFLKTRFRSTIWVFFFLRKGKIYTHLLEYP